jgi:hypothetical protein
MSAKTIFVFRRVTTGYYYCSTKNMKRTISGWFCLATFACACLAETNSPPSLTQADRDDICETVFKHYAKSGRFVTDLIFLCMPGVADPTDSFMTRFRDYQPKAEKVSMASRDDSPGRQVRHKVTRQAGAIVYIAELTTQTNGTVRVRMGYDIFALGGGNDSFVLSRSNSLWSVTQEIRGVVY